MKIQKTIRKHGFTIEKVANELNINRVTLTTSLNGNPTLKKLQDVARVIGCSVGEFFDDEREQHSAPTHVCPHCGKELHITIE